MGLYNASAQLQQLGVISGVDMTPEAALVKMMFLLGQGYDRETLKEQMQKNLRGEQKYNVFNLFWSGSANPSGAYAPFYGTVHKPKAQSVAAGFEKTKIHTANIRLDGIELKKGGTDVEIAVYMNYPQAKEDSPTEIPQCIAVISGNLADSNSFVVDCTEKVKQVIDPNRPVQITVVSKSGEIAWKNAMLSVFTDTD